MRGLSNIHVLQVLRVAESPQLRAMWSAVMKMTMGLLPRRLQVFPYRPTALLGNTLSPAHALSSGQTLMLPIKLFHCMRLNSLPLPLSHNWDIRPGTF